MTYGVAPACNGRCILPDFSLTWVLTIWDYYWQTGDLTPFMEQHERIKKIFQYFERKDLRNSDGLLIHDHRFWLFEDWCSIPKDPIPCFLNLWHLYALEYYAKLLTAAKLHDEVSYVTKTIADRRELLTQKFFNPQTSLFEACIDWNEKFIGEPSVHDQVLALFMNIKPRAAQAMLEKRLLPFVRGNALTCATPSAFWSSYLLECLDSRGYGADAIEFIHKNWKQMIPCGTTWEKFSFDASTTVSCSHAWSAHPAFHLVNILVGLRQTAPAWREAEWRPCLNNNINHAQATIPTPNGLLSASWAKSGDKVRGHIEIPADMIVHVTLPGGPEKIFARRLPSSLVPFLSVSCLSLCFLTAAQYHNYIKSMIRMGFVLMIDDSKRQPKYRQLRDILAADIRAGKYPVGTKLPAERTLEEMFSVSRVSVRQALKALFAKGYLQKGPGARAVVRNPDPMEIKDVKIYRNMAFVSQRDFGYSLAVYRLLYEAIMRECHGREIRLFYVDVSKPLPDFLCETDFTAVFITGDGAKRPTIDPLLTTQTRLIAIDENIWDDRVMIVGTDNFQCGALAAKILLQRNCRKPLFIGTKHSYFYHPFTERKNGFANTMAEAGIPCMFYDVDMDVGGGLHVDELLEYLRGSECDGIFASHDTVAITTLNVLLKLGKNVPDEIAVVGMDGLDSGAYSIPPLSSVAQPIAEIARVAVDEALASEFQVKRILIPGILLKRQSA